MGGPSAQHRLSSPVLSSDNDSRHAFRVDTVKIKADAVERGVRELESLAQDFKRKVDSVAVEFEDLREELNEYALEHDALLTDHSMALASLDEEKVTSERYHGYLRNAEVEIKILKSLVPDDQLDYQVGFSQARP